MLLSGLNAIVFTNNVVTGHAKTGTALNVLKSMQQRELFLTATGNSFSDFENAVHIEQACCSVTALFAGEITGNVFAFPILAAPQAAFIDTGLQGTLDLRNNSWGDNTDVATVKTYIVNNSDPDLELMVAPVMP